MEINQLQSTGKGLTSFFKDAPEMAWVNVKGDSMTSNSGISIPDKSKVLIKKIPKDPFGIPTRRPVVITGEADGEKFLVCKLITFIDMVYNRVKCESLNTKYKPFWIPLHCILDIYEVEEVAEG